MTQHHCAERVPALQNFVASSSFLGTLTASSGRRWENMYTDVSIVLTGLIRRETKWKDKY